MRSRIWKATKFALLGLVALAFTLVGSGFAYRAYRQHRNANTFAIQSARGIADGRFVTIGGIHQWIQIRGEDTGNPVLLILHGGPGASYVPATSLFLHWEKFFTVVQWDQRGTGRTFGRNRADGSGEMTVDRMVRDGIEVLEYLRQRLQQGKIILYGTSWGTILGTAIAQRRPDLLSAYVGSGQVVDMARNEAIGYDTLLRTVRQARDDKAIAALTAIGPPPYKDLTALGIQRDWQYRYVSPEEKNFQKSLLWGVVFAPDYSVKDILDYGAGSTFSIKALFKDMMATDLRSLGTNFQVPIIVIQGADDTLTPTSLVKEYYASIVAPRKELVVIPHAGHLVFLAMPDRMLAEFIAHVRPLALHAPTRAH
jgi:pimeloyl-ACP methyl ester carboxylesterase